MISLLKENASRTAMEIGGLTGLNKDAIQKFVDTHNMDIEKVYQYVKKSKLTDRLNFVTAVVGTPGNPVQKRMIKMFGESVSEAKYPTDLKIGSVILGQGFTMLKGIEGGRYYKIVDMDDFSATLVPSDKNGNVKGSKKVRHKLDSIEGGIKTAKRGDENGIVVIKESVNESQDHEVSMAQNSLDSIIKYATELKQKMGEMEKDIPAWIQSYITMAGEYISQASSNYHEYGSGMNEGKLNEMDRQLNVKVNKMLQRELGDLRKGGPNHQFAIMYILQGALTDANFHSTSRKVPSLFPRAKYEGDPMAEKDLIQMYEYEIGPNIAALAKWDGKDIVDAIGFYVSMTIGRPMGEKIEKLVEGKK